MPEQEIIVTNMVGTNRKAALNNNGKKNDRFLHIQ
jgi:hypothetical protein